MAANTKGNRLPNSFFRANPLMKVSAAVLAHYSIAERLDEKLNLALSAIEEQGIDGSRRKRIQEERRLIEETGDPAALVEILRRGHDIFNRRLLCGKILEHHEQAVPLLLSRYRTCMLDHFIDAATVVFATGEPEYARMLRELYADIRSPFAQACACLVFGMQGMQEEIPFLLHEYGRFQREYPEETYHQHPLLALYLLHGKY